MLSITHCFKVKCGNPVFQFSTDFFDITQILCILLHTKSLPNMTQLLVQKIPRVRLKKVREYEAVN